MPDSILLGQGSQITVIPRQKWEERLSRVPQHTKTRLGFMTAAHHQVRNFVVRELPRTGKPIQPDYIAHSLELPLVQVNMLLDELEKNLFFLVRNSQGAVSWAYPVTVEQTPHKLVFSSGESLYGA